MASLSDPKVRKKLALWHLVATIPLALLSVLAIIFLPPVWGQVILMLISWYAITITAADVLATTDVRTEVGSD